MRQMEFKMERQGLLEEGQEVNVTESALLLYDYPGNGHEQELSSV